MIATWKNKTNILIFIIEIEYGKESNGKGT